MPQRIQRRRTKGWKMPEGAVYVGRPTKWGNPYRPQDYQFPEDCLADYRRWLNVQIAVGEIDLAELRDKDLACFCPLNKPCHADVLLELANGGAQ